MVVRTDQRRHRGDRRLSGQLHQPVHAQRRTAPGAGGVRHRGRPCAIVRVLRGSGQRVARTRAAVHGAPTRRGQCMPLIPNPRPSESNVLIFEPDLEQNHPQRKIRTRVDPTAAPCG